jgi:hypothetical protein
MTDTKHDSIVSEKWDKSGTKVGQMVPLKIRLFYHAIQTPTYIEISRMTLLLAARSLGRRGNMKQDGMTVNDLADSDVLQ